MTRCPHCKTSLRIVGIAADEDGPGIDPRGVVDLLRVLLDIIRTELVEENLLGAFHATSVASGMLKEAAPEVMAHRCYDEEGAA